VGESGEASIHSRRAVRGGDFWGVSSLAWKYVVHDAQWRVSLGDHLARARRPLNTSQALRWRYSSAWAWNTRKRTGSCATGTSNPPHTDRQGRNAQDQRLWFGGSAEAACLGSRGGRGSLVTRSEGGEFGFSLIQAGAGQVRYSRLHGA